jgi:hypothetical protein
VRSFLPPMRRGGALAAGVVLTAGVVVMRGSAKCAQRFWIAVAAAIAFPARAHERLPYGPTTEGGSCCYRTPRRLRRSMHAFGAEFRVSGSGFQFPTSL